MNTMRKGLWIILAGLLMSIAAPAHATSYTPTFTCYVTSCISEPTAPDVTFPSPASITVTWDTLSFPLSLALDAPNDAYEFIGQVGTDIFGAKYEVFEITDETIGRETSYTYYNPSTISFRDAGILTFSATPEPSTVGLMLLGIGIAIVMQKRFAKRLHLAS